MSYHKGHLLPLLTTALIGCGEKVDPQDYFPLTPSLKWQYQVTESLINQQRVYLYEVENRSYQTRKELSDAYQNIPVAIRHTHEGTNYYIIKEG